MGLFDNIFGRKKLQTPLVPAAQSQPPPPSPKASVDPSKDPNMIQVFDAYGRELFISKEQWRTNVLPGSIRSNWNKPDELYGIIFGALQDGFRADVLEAAKRLYDIDTDPARGTCVWGIVLKEEGRLDEAEKVFRDFIARHGENGSVLTNLAKIHSRRQENAKAEEILWHALEVDANQDNGLMWYQAIYRERGGEEAALEALRRVASLPCSWRAQLWLARRALQNRKLDEALPLYHEALAHATKPVPLDLLMQISGDLGNAGHIPEILQLVEPHFDARIHGLQVGNNLIKAYVELRDFDAARRILDQLYGMNRLDWKQTLSFWDTEIAKGRLASTPLDQKIQFKMAMLTIEGPVWLKPSSPAAELFPAKPSETLTIAFLGSTAEIASNSKHTEHQLANLEGRLSRSIPLFLAEQVEFNSHARVQTLVPWLVETASGFVLSGMPWKDEEAANCSRQGELKSDYVILSHLKAQAEPWTVELRLIRSIDGKRLSELSATFLSAKPQETIPALAGQLLELLARDAEVASQAPPQSYQVPAGLNFPYYLLRLEQLLAVRCGGMDGVPKRFLSGERDIIDGNIQMCLACPANTNTRILLANTLLAMKKVRPDILPEFKDKLALLQKEKTLGEPAQGIIQRMIIEALTI
jgi:tetratricopeptide (TPR) repeat protein